MRARALVLACVLLAAGLAGCVGGDDSSDADDGALEETAVNETNETDTSELETEDTGPDVNVTWNNGTVQGGSLVLFPYCAPGCQNVYSFDVPNGTNAIVVELGWNASASLTLDVQPPTKYCETGPAGIILTNCPEDAEDDDGENPARIEITDPERTNLTGEWDVFVWPQDSYAEPVEYTSAASVVTKGGIPSGYAQVGSG